MRRQIQKQLATRSEAIKTAIKKYNSLARALDPPRETLEISKVLEYTFLAEFDLLKNSRDDVRTCPWATPVNREYTQRYFRVQAAREEIIRLNVEICRLATSIEDESSFFPQKIAQLQVSDPSLATVVEQRWKLRQAVNEIHLRNLSKASKLPGFTGTLSPGKRRIHIPHISEQAPISDQTDTLEAVIASADEMSDYSDLDDEVVDTAAALEQWHISLL